MDKLFESGEVEFSRLSAVDECGKVFFWNGRVFRAITAGAEESVRRMFSCGMIEELVAANLFPRSWITGYRLTGYSLVIEHEAIHPVTYPYEWSFLMLKEAAVAILRTNIVARKYGYQTKDCHGFNVVFDDLTPKFVDLGSFVQVDPGYGGWLAYDEFLRFYYYPLVFWRDGGGYVARRLLLGNDMVPHVNYLLYRYPFLRQVSLDLLDRAARSYFKFKNLSILPLDTLRFRGEVRLKPLLRFLKRNRLLPLQSVDLHDLQGKVERLSRKSSSSTWGDYHEGLIQNGDVRPTPRFSRIAGILKGLEIATVTELAGNRGALSLLLLREGCVTGAICTDYDENAIDGLVELARQTGRTVAPVVLDFVYPIVTSYAKHPKGRLVSDIALALAVTHHLLLTQKIGIDTVLESVAGYTRRYVGIEFMPLGLHDGHQAPPVPEWYTLEWFRKNFINHFDCILEEKLEENRVFFLGTLRQSVESCD